MAHLNLARRYSKSDTKWTERVSPVRPEGRRANCAIRARGVAYLTIGCD